MKRRHLLCALLLSTTLTLTACSSGLSPATPAASIYLDYNAVGTSVYQPEIVSYPTSGTPTPAILSGTPSASAAFVGIAVDIHGNIYTSVYNIAARTTDILVFAPGSTGTASPIRTFTYSQMTAPVYDLAVDIHGNVYVFDYNADMFKFGPTASGVTVPLLTLTGIEVNSGITTDAQGNLYVAVYGLVTSGTAPPYTGDTIYVYNDGFSSITPSRIITPPVGQYIDGLAVDQFGTLYAAGELIAGTGVGRIDAYAPTASGAATPLRTITGAATKLAGSAASLSTAFNNLAIDLAGTLYVRSIDPAGSNLSVINQFSSTASGNVAPTSSVTTTLSTALNFDIAVY